MAEAILLGPVLRIGLYVAGPLIIRFAYSGVNILSNGKKWIIAFVWAAIATFIASMIATGGNINLVALAAEIAGGTLAGGIVGDIILSIKPKDKKPTTGITDTNAIKLGPEEPMGSNKHEDDQAEKAESAPSIVSADETINTHAASAEESSINIESLGAGASDAETSAETIDEVEERSFIVPDEELRLLKRLHDAGVLSDAEFKEKKKTLLKI